MVEQIIEQGKTFDCLWDAQGKIVTVTCKELSYNKSIDAQELTYESMWDMLIFECLSELNEVSNI